MLVYFLSLALSRLKCWYFHPPKMWNVWKLWKKLKVKIVQNYMNVHGFKFHQDRLTLEEARGRKPCCMVFSTFTSPSVFLIQMKLKTKNIHIVLNNLTFTFSPEFSYIEFLFFKNQFFWRGGGCKYQNSNRHGARVSNTTMVFLVIDMPNLRASDAVCGESKKTSLIVVARL